MLHDPIVTTIVVACKTEVMLISLIITNLYDGLTFDLCGSMFLSIPLLTNDDLHGTPTPSGLGLISGVPQSASPNLCLCRYGGLPQQWTMDYQ